MYKIYLKMILFIFEVKYIIHSIKYFLKLYELEYK